MIEAIEKHEGRITNTVKVRFAHPIRDGIGFGIGFILAPVILIVILALIAGVVIPLL